MSVNPDCSIAPVPVHGVVVFEPAAFKVLYAQFVAVSDATLTFFFDLATLILNNSCRSIVADGVMRERLLNLLVAHIATLQPTATGGGGGSGPALAGVISSATEGTVSVDAVWLSQVSQSMAWFIQTQYGALFWQLTSPFRSFRSVPAPQCCGPAGAYAGRRGY